MSRKSFSMAKQILKCFGKLNWESGPTFLPEETYISQKLGSIIPSDWVGADLEIEVSVHLARTFHALGNQKGAFMDTRHTSFLPYSVYPHHSVIAPPSPILYYSYSFFLRQYYCQGARVIGEWIGCLTCTLLTWVSSL